VHLQHVLFLLLYIEIFRLSLCAQIPRILSRLLVTSPLVLGQRASLFSPLLSVCWMCPQWTADSLVCVVLSKFLWNGLVVHAIKAPLKPPKVKSGLSRNVERVEHFSPALQRHQYRCKLDIPCLLPNRLQEDNRCQGILGILLPSLFLLVSCL